MLKEFDINEFKFNPFELIGKEWMLIACGDQNAHNMMTASWGGLGVLWEKNVATVYIRPTRYTYEFVQKKDYFSLNFFGGNKAPHKIGGSKSGRDIDKAKAAGLTPVFDCDTVYYKEAELVIICKKLYCGQILKENFLDDNIDKFYPLKDYHKIFIGEIVKSLKIPQRI
ncbi:MAG: flavin reductase [Christensenellales bacterium]|jgi:flavin reductase (DIM6/NTAB) family NADH-FMN oxidoreductase RutF|nr:flavin reductase family protein [Clostridiales bacterium]